MPASKKRNRCYTKIFADVYEFKKEGGDLPEEML